MRAGGASRSCSPLSGSTSVSGIATGRTGAASPRPTAVRNRSTSARVMASSRLLPSAGNRYYEDPEADSVYGAAEGWQPIVDDKNHSPTDNVHVKCKPSKLRYKIWLRLSEMEYGELENENAALLDSPVFDDITVTYMRRPRVIEWREVSE